MHPIPHPSFIPIQSSETTSFLAVLALNAYHSPGLMRGRQRRKRKNIKRNERVEVNARESNEVQESRTSTISFSISTARQERVYALYTSPLRKLPAKHRVHQPITPSTRHAHHTERSPMHRIPHPPSPSVSHSNSRKPIGRTCPRCILFPGSDARLTAKEEKQQKE